MANIDASITALCLYYDDLVQAKVTIHDTLAKYLDARNFPEGNTRADPTQEKRKVFFIDAKSEETNEAIEFTLASPMDLQGIMIPTRQLHSICTGVSETNTAAAMDVIIPASDILIRIIHLLPIRLWMFVTALCRPVNYALAKTMSCLLEVFPARL